jgi:glycosyltransferase involved in cell wall biosynthesis
MTPLYPPFVGGIEVFASGLCAALRARGHAIRVACSHSGATLPDVMEMDGVVVHRMPLLEGVMQRKPALLLKTQKTLRQLAQDFRPDVVHLHVGGPIVHAYLGCAALQPIPLLVSVHDLPQQAGEFPTVQRVLEKARHVVANSQARLADAVNFAPEARERMHCIHVGRPAPAIRQSTGRSPTPLICMAGRQVEYKGFDVAVEAFALLRAAHPTARLVLAGDGPAHADLRGLIKARGLEQVVELTGRIDDAALMALHAKAWIGLVPSRHSESFGLVALEAMQAGCAVVASRTGGLPEVVDDGVTGILVEPGSPVDLARALHELLGDPARTFAMGDAGRERAGRVFDWERCVDDYETILIRTANP